MSWNLITQHPAVCAIAAYWIFSAFSGGMPAPTATSSATYQWLYNSLHILAGNITSAVQSKYPNLPVDASLTQHTETTTVVAKETNA